MNVFFFADCLIFTGSAKARSDQLSWRSDSWERSGANTGIGSKSSSDICSTGSTHVTNSGKFHSTLNSSRSFGRYLKEFVCVTDNYQDAFQCRAQQRSQVCLACNAVCNGLFYSFIQDSVFHFALFNAAGCWNS